MNEKHNYCKIVQDLLPSYIEKLTDEETNKFVEEHINSCDKCKKIYNELLNSNNEKEKTIAKKEIKYMKKYKNKMSILKIVLLVILIFIVIYIGRNMIIMLSLQNKSSKYYDSTNYHIERYSYRPDSTSLVEVYKKDDKSMQRDIVYNMYEKNNEILSYTSNEIGTHVYFMSEKIFGTKNEQIEPWMDVKSIDYMQTQNLLEFLLESVVSQITTVECNGKECYKIDTLGVTTYVDKETGLTTRILNMATSFREHNYERAESSVDDIFYEFDSVTDEDFVEPDTTGFEKTEIK